MNESKVFTNHTVAVYASHDQAEAALKALEKSGYPLKNLSLVGQNYETIEQPVGFINSGDRMWSWGKLGVFWGGIWGLLFGSAMMFIPGVGSVMFAGYIIAALEGALLGGSLGVIGGALVSVGVPKDSVVHYESALKAGSFLVIAHGSETEVLAAKQQLQGFSPTQIDSYSSDLAEVTTK